MLALRVMCPRPHLFTNTSFDKVKEKLKQKICSIIFYKIEQLNILIFTFNYFLDTMIFKKK